MTVIRPNSISGINSITGTGGDISIFRADGTAADVTVNNITSGVVTATTFVGNITGNPTGSGANLTSIPAAQLTGTVADARLSTVSSSKLSGALPALDGSSLTGVGVGTADSINTSGIITATAFVPTTGQLSHRNLVINGAMIVAQRGVTSTVSGYGSVDRFKVISTGVDESPTQAQVDVSSGTSPYTSGFRKALKVTNGNQTSGAGAGDFIWIQTIIEAQDIANSGWNYTSSSSHVTLSFWVKSSVAQDFKGYLRSSDGTNYEYPFATGSLSADTWTKVTKTISGNSNLQFDTDYGPGLEINIIPFLGTNRTDGSVTEDAWATYNSSARTKDHTSTWYTTNDATFEITGVQLEVGSVVTPFEHRSFGEELIRCKRYFNMVADGADKRTGQTRSEGVIGNGFFWQSTRMMVPVKFQVAMRTPNWTLYKKNGEYRYYANGSSNQTCTQNDIGLNGQDGSNSAHLNITNISSSSAAGLFFVHDVDAALGFDAEL